MGADAVQPDDAGNEHRLSQDPPYGGVDPGIPFSVVESRTVAANLEIATLAGILGWHPGPGQHRAGRMRFFRQGPLSKQKTTGGGHSPLTPGACAFK